MSERQQNQRCAAASEQGMDLLVRFCGGELEGRAAAAFESHVAECDSCRQLVQAQKAMLLELDQWEAPPVSSDFDERLYARIAEECRAPWWKRTWLALVNPVTGNLPWSKAIPVGAACALLAATFVVYPPTSSKRSDQVPAVQSAESIDVEQVERTLEDLDMLKEITSAREFHKL
jgi:anti-sigma factor RsiW